MAKAPAPRPAGKPPRDPTRMKVAEMREKHARIWMEARGFVGDFGRNGVDFLARELGITKEFVAGVLDGAVHLGIRSALAMRRTISRDVRVKEYDYRVFTDGIYELIGLGEASPLDSADTNAEGRVEPVVTTEEVEPGIDAQGRTCVVVLFADGSKASVILPPGTIVDGKPTVVFGRSQTTGSITLLLVNESPGGKQADS